MKRLGGGLLITAVALAAALLAQACSDGEPTATDWPVPEITTAMASGVLKCAQWSMSYDVCRMRPGEKAREGYADPYAWDGCACCLEHTFDASKVATKPKCKIENPGSTCSGSYWLDPGTNEDANGMPLDPLWLDDVWYCDASQACCAAGSGDEDYYGDPADRDTNTYADSVPNPPPNYSTDNNR
jgi:hypothetical protein